ncbi:MAG TPA: trehalose-6-phosphate synthase [Patescibacteria group bacterium]|jgi:trehalose-6-phosphate synthase|nr:trehalose-6-phosphate synthase [Patescibacteria group bacterium]
MYIVSNVPPAFNKNNQLNVYGGLAVAVIDSIPEDGAVWAGIVTDPNDNKTSYDAVHRVERLPIVVEDKPQYLLHYGMWCKGKVYAAFHNLMEYAGLVGDRFSEDAVKTEEYYKAHVHTIDDFGKKLAKEIHRRDTIAGAKEPIMVHDYQLIELAESLRKHGLKDRTIGIFLHVPFPEPENFWLLPHADEVLDAYLEHDMISFQDEEYSQKNFLNVVREYYPNAQYDAAAQTLHVNGRSIAVKSFAASINPADTLEDAKNAENHPAVQDILSRAGDRKIIFSAQRFDIIKGIPQALAAVEQLLDEKPELAKDTYFVFCCQGTKYDGLRCYDEYQQESLDIIQRINDKHPGTFELVNGLPREAVLGLMRHTDVMYVPTIIEGQNLVVKEFIIAKEDGAKPGVALLSTGCAAYQGLKDTGGVFIHNPSDVADQKACLERALTMAVPEQEKILKAQQEAIHAWTSLDYGRGLTDALHQSGGLKGTAPGYVPPAADGPSKLDHI